MPSLPVQGSIVASDVAAGIYAVRFWWQADPDPNPNPNPTFITLNKPNPNPNQRCALLVAGEMGGGGGR